MALDDKLVKEWSARFGILEKLEEGVAQDPSNPSHIDAFILGYHNIGKPEEEQNTRVPPEAYKLYHPTYLRYELAQEQARAASNLVDEIKKDYKAGLNLVKDKNLLSILEDMPPVKDVEDSYKDIQSIHSAYFNIAQIEKSKDEKAKIEAYIQVNGYKGKAAEIVREFYAEHKGAINIQLLQMKEKIREELHKKLNGADETKNYIIANLDKIPEDKRDPFYLAIGKRVE
ncbi:hypothetical protein HYV49_04695 [Candidatus Pacearchaeota archaeon]|nr:hypothetical protein [Candidatus Pacearchaeota archaeon]